MEDDHSASLSGKSDSAVFCFSAAAWFCKVFTDKNEHSKAIVEADSQSLKFKVVPGEV